MSVFALLDVASLAVVSGGRPSDGSAWGTVVVAMFFFVVMAVIGTAMASPQDRSWLPMVIIGGFIVKLLGSTARYLVLELVYNGRGDATGYHGAGLRLSAVWRSFRVPSTIDHIGTDVVDAITGLLYVPYRPSMLGGFFIFASLAFLGQLLLYAAFRHSFPARHLKWYAACIFFWPTIVYWPSSIGKESLMLFWIGVASYGVARLLKSYNPAWVALISLGLAGAGIIRLHIPLLLAGSLVIALLVAKAPAVRGALVRRVGLLVAASAALVVFVLLTAGNFGVDLSAAVSVEAATDEVGNVLSAVEAKTDTGGSSITGSAVTSPLDLPEAMLRVLFRPLITEGTTLPLLASSLDGTVLLVVFVLRLPWILRNLFRSRRTPYAIYGFLYTGGFVIAFSSILNLGILARQRSQMVPFFLALLVVWGRKHVEEEPDESSLEPPANLRELEPVLAAHHPALTLVQSISSQSGSSNMSGSGPTRVRNPDPI